MFEFTHGLLLDGGKKNTVDIVLSSCSRIIILTKRVLCKPCLKEKPTVQCFSIEISPKHFKSEKTMEDSQRTKTWIPAKSKYPSIWEVSMIIFNCWMVKNYTWISISDRQIGLYLKKKLFETFVDIQRSVMEDCRLPGRLADMPVKVKTITLSSNVYVTENFHKIYFAVWGSNFRRKRPKILNVYGTWIFAHVSFIQNVSDCKF